MILKNRQYKRITPDRDAKSIYIFCEGARRELDYFNFFRGIDSRINVEVYPLDPHEDNSPLGLLDIAKRCIIKIGDNEPKYDLMAGDEVWIVLDIDKDKDDSRAPQIKEVEKACQAQKNWFLVKSNPCFEVWLYYHVNREKPVFDAMSVSKSWKPFVNNSVKGGFDSRTHPVLIENAALFAQYNYQNIAGVPDVACTDVFHLANSIIPLVKRKLDPQELMDKLGLKV